MIEIKDIGTYESLPQIVSDIINQDISALNDHLANDWNINKAIEVDKYTCITPLDFALIMECFDSVRWLVEHGANLNVKENPSFLTAVRYCDGEIVKYIAVHGAKINEVNNIKSEAFEQAIFGERFDNLPVIHELGHTVEKYGGNAFRKVVSERNYAAADFFIANGVDINYNKSDMVYPFKPTALCVAARYVDLEMCKYLVERGADVSIPESDGMRPYSIAVEKGDMEMAEYFRSLEPADFHSLQNKLDELRPYKLPKVLLDFLQGDNLRIDLPNSDCKYIEFFTLTETVPFKSGRQKLLRLSKTSGGDDHIVFVWNPKSKKLAYYDTEHQELGDMCGFADFLKTPEVYTENIF